MRIAFFVDSFPVISETFIVRQITGLLDLGHEVDIYAARTPSPQEPVHREIDKYSLLSRTTYLDQQMPEDSGVWEMPVWPISGQTWLPGAEQAIPNAKRVARAIPSFARCLLKTPRATLEVLKPKEYGYQAESLSALYRLDALRRRRTRYDILHAHFGPTGSMFRFARRLWNAPLIVTFHGYDFTSLPRQQGPKVYERLFATADLVTVNSRYASDRLKELGCAGTRVRQLNVGVDLREFTFRARRRHPGDSLSVLSVGRLVEKKGFEYSIRAVTQLSAKYPDLRYDIVGDGPLRADLEQLIRQLGVERTVVLHGVQMSSVVRRLMAEAHLFVLSSVTAANGDQEGTPVSLMEAQATGLPVVSTWHSGIPEVVLHERCDLRKQVLRCGPDAVPSPPIHGNLWSRAFLEQVFPMPEEEFRQHSDTYLYTLAPAAGPVGRVTEPLGYYRMHGGNDYAGRPFEERNRRNLEMYQRRCRILRDYLRRNGVEVAEDTWKQQSAYYHWMQQIHRSLEELRSAVPAGEPLILVDNAEWGNTQTGHHVMADHQTIPFLEREGQYWGAPPDDESAIGEVDVKRTSGVRFIVFTGSTSWYLEHYAGFAAYLRSNGHCILTNDRLIIFELTT